MQKTNRQSPVKPWFLGVALVGLLGGALLIAAFVHDSVSPVLCKAVFGDSAAQGTAVAGESYSGELQRNAIVHYATSREVPQQSFAEISISLDVLKILSPCNFLVFGLGRDSLMWASLNPRGTTLFLEEDPQWVQTVLKDAPYLRAHTVNYRTKLSEAEELITLYKDEPECSARKSYLRGNDRCKLALNMLSEEVYDKEWDLIMIDAPRGYFPEAPGRMAAIYSAAVMARNRKKSGVTHVFLHDVDRKVERVYSEMFLCRKNLVKEVGRLRHFAIAPTTDVNEGFC